MKSVMYHYVREARSQMPYFRYLHIDNFRKQLDHFQENYIFPDQEQFLECFKTQRPIKKGIILTFDDGLRDHYDYVFPELERRGLWGIFYVPTGPLQDGAALNVHIIHRLLGEFGGASVLEALRRLVKPKMLKHAHIEEFRELTYPDQEDDIIATTISKRVLNYFIGIEWQDVVIQQLIAGFSINAIEDVYLSAEQIKEIHARGNMIGSHSVSHPLFSKLTADQQRNEISDSFAHLKAILGTSFIRTFCYPYGGFHSFTPVTEMMLSDSGCAFSFNVEHRDIEPNDLNGGRQALPRYDCNAFPFGKAN